MGNGTNQPIRDDLFSLDQSPAGKPVSQREQLSSPLQQDQPARAKLPSYQLPTNLPSALSHLDDDQLQRLLMAVNVELGRRGKKARVHQTTEPKRSQEESAPPLAFGKINAIRAAFKAGVKPLAIAKQFGVTKADVYRALEQDTLGQQRSTPMP